MRHFSSGSRFEYRTQARWALLFFALAFLGLSFRFFQLQILRGDEFERLSQIDQIRPARIKARRGEIWDRAGRKIARNVEVHKAYLIPARVRDPEQITKTLAQLLALQDEEAASILDRLKSARGSNRFERVSLSKELVGSRCPKDDHELQPLQKPHNHLWCPNCGRHFEQWRRGSRRCHMDGFKLVVSGEGRHARCKECGVEYLRESICPYDGTALRTRKATLRCPQCNHRYNNELAMVQSRRDELPGLYTDTKFRRDYPHGALASTPVGYTNEVNAKEVKKEPKIYRPGDHIGRRGLERSLESILRGANGEYIYLRRKNTVTQADKELLSYLEQYTPTAAKHGHNVVLTIDLEVQSILKDAMSRYPAGAAVVVNPQTGAILGMYSTPSFDPNHWANRMTRDIKNIYDENQYSPMVDRTIRAYPPASLFKVVTALAALDLGIVDEESTFHCGGYYEFANRRFHCHKRYGGHEEVKLEKSLVKSCDVYYYRVSELMGLDRLSQYARDVFTVGASTGIEMAEQKGWVPTKKRYYRNKKVAKFKPGWTLSSSVGQGSLEMTPLQIAVLYSAIANDGNIPKIHVVKKVVDDKNNVIRETKAEIIKTLPFRREHLDAVRASLYHAVHREDGTASKAMHPDIVVAGKTGTAEAKEYRKGATKDFAEWLKKDHAWFAGFAPVTRPEIVVVVLLEHGGSGGKEAAPLFREIVHRIFDQRLNLPISEGP